MRWLLRMSSFLPLIDLDLDLLLIVVHRGEHLAAAAGQRRVAVQDRGEAEGKLEALHGNRGT